MSRKLQEAIVCGLCVALGFLLGRAAQPNEGDLVDQSQPPKSAEGLGVVRATTSAIAKYRRTNDPETKASVIAGWVATDPERAFHIWNTRLIGKERLAVGELLFRSWSALDPLTAFTRAKSLSPVDNERKRLLEVVLQEALESAPMIASDLLATGESHQVKVELTKWMTEDPEAGFAYLNGIAVSSNRSAMLKSLAKSWAAVNPAQAAEAYSKLSYANGISEIVSIWAGESFDEAAAFVAKTTGPMKAKLCGQLVEKWPNENLSQGVAWATENLTGNVRENGLSVLFRRMDSADAFEAIDASSGRIPSDAIYNLVQSRPQSGVISEILEGISSPLQRLQALNAVSLENKEDLSTSLDMVDNRSERMALIEMATDQYPSVVDMLASSPELSSYGEEIYESYFARASISFQLNDGTWADELSAIEDQTLRRSAINGIAKIVVRDREHYGVIMDRLSSQDQQLLSEALQEFSFQSP